MERTIRTCWNFDMRFVHQKRKRQDANAWRNQVFQDYKVISFTKYICQSMPGAYDIHSFIHSFIHSLSYNRNCKSLLDIQLQKCFRYVTCSYIRKEINCFLSINSFRSFQKQPRCNFEVLTLHVS